MTTIERPAPIPSAGKPLPHAAFRAIPRPGVVGAVFKRDLVRYFSNPSGYLFITVFVFVSSWVAFCQQAFFNRNLANLDTLNYWMPILLLFFVPAITMTTWADERRQGTDELLLTLPARDAEVVLGKYLAALGIYTIALGFTLSHVVILYMLGTPDLGVMFATYFGYWLMGAMLISVGMVASLLSSTATVAFILGALFTAIPVLFNQLGSLGGERTGRVLEDLSVSSQFHDFGGGVIPIGGVFYFVSLTLAMLYVNVVLLGRRHWAGGEHSEKHGMHAAIRLICLFCALASVCVLVNNLGWRIDATSERLHTLSDETMRVIKKIPSDRPVFIQAYYSPEVPRDYVAVKDDLINTLKQASAMSNGRIRLNLIETDLFSTEARNAQKQFGIEPRQVMVVGEAKQSAEEIMLGVAFTSGAQEVVIPFFDRGLPVEYEITRSIRVVSREARKKVGVLDTDAKLMGGFDFKSMSQSREWNFVTELKKQYDVVSVSLDAPYPVDLDALIAPQPSSLTQKQVNALATYVRNGHPTLLFLDPLPVSNPEISPEIPKKPPGGMFGGGPPPEPKGSLAPLLDALGLDWPSNQIVWNPYNPHPLIQISDQELVFIGPGSNAEEPFNPKQVITSGLQEVLLFFPGLLRPKGGPGPEMIPLLQTNDRGGTLAFNEIVQQNFMGIAGTNPYREYIPTGKSYILAARFTGKAAPDEAEAASKDAKKADKAAESLRAEVRAVAIADLDLVSEQILELRRSGNENFVFDNVTFVLNCVDVLAGDESMVGLRKHRKQHRTLTRVEKITQKFIDDGQDQVKKAEEQAKVELNSAQKRLDDKVDALKNNKSLDVRTKQIMLDNISDVEKRRLDVEKASIEDDKRRAILESKADMERTIRSVQNNIRYLAIGIPPLPALVLGLVVLGVRLKREYIGVNVNRLA